MEGGSRESSDLQKGSSPKSRPGGDGVGYRTPPFSFVTVALHIRRMIRHSLFQETETGSSDIEDGRRDFDRLIEQSKTPLIFRDSVVSRTVRVVDKYIQYDSILSN